MSSDSIIGVAPLSFPWQTKDPFLVCVHHVDQYPKGNDRLGPAATLQALASKENPILIRIETKSGHGASSLTKSLEATGDIYAFLMHNLGVDPKVP